MRIVQAISRLADLLLFLRQWGLQCIAVFVQVEELQVI